MMTRTMMALAAVPVVLLAGGGVAVAQTAGGPAGTAVVQPVGAHHGGDCGRHQARTAVTVMARHDSDRACDGTRHRDRAHAVCQPGAQAGSGMMARAHHGEDRGGCGDR
jgi:hypothetical protein